MFLFVQQFEAQNDSTLFLTGIHFLKTENQLKRFNLHFEADSS